MLTPEQERAIRIIRDSARRQVKINENKAKLADLRRNPTVSNDPRVRRKYFQNVDWYTKQIANQNKFDGKAKRLILRPRHPRSSSEYDLQRGKIIGFVAVVVFLFIVFGIVYVVVQNQNKKNEEKEKKR